MIYKQASNFDWINVLWKFNKILLSSYQSVLNTNYKIVRALHLVFSGFFFIEKEMWVHSQIWLLNNLFLLVTDLYKICSRCYFSFIAKLFSSVLELENVQITQGYVQPDWGYFEWTEQIISINPFKLIQTFFVMILKIYLFFQNKANNRK